MRSAEPELENSGPALPDKPAEYRVREATRHHTFIGS
jgi:hypothetical protein